MSRAPARGGGRFFFLIIFDSLSFRNARDERMVACNLRTLMGARRLLIGTENVCGVPPRRVVGISGPLAGDTTTRLGGTPIVLGGDTSDFRCGATGFQSCMRRFSSSRWFASLVGTC